MATLLNIFISKLLNQLSTLIVPVLLERDAGIGIIN